MIPAYWPQARGRNFGTWQGRLPQELRLHGVDSLEGANRFLREYYIAEFNDQFTVKAAQPGTAFRKCARRGLDGVFSIQTERVVEKDNTVAIRGRRWQIDKCRLRYSLVGQTVTIHEHLDGAVSIRYGPHVVGRWAEGRGKDGAVEAVENQTQVSHRSHRPLDPKRTHFPTASTTISPLSPKTKAKRVA